MSNLLTHKLLEEKFKSSKTFFKIDDDNFICSDQRMAYKSKGSLYSNGEYVEEVLFGACFESYKDKYVEVRINGVYNHFKNGVKITAQDHMKALHW